MRAPNPIDVYVGKRLRMRRLMLDMSQEALADALGLTFQQVQKYEKGANRVVFLDQMIVIDNYQELFIDAFNQFIDHGDHKLVQSNLASGERL